MLIDRHPADWKETLHASLADARGAIYALVDGVHNELFYQQLKKAGCFHYESLYSTAPSADEETLGLAPILVQYSDEHRNQWDALIELTNGLPALSIIISPEPIEQMAARLIPWCVVDADGYTLALSFADTRILPALVNALTPQQRGQLFGPASLWSYPGRDAEWQRLSVKSENALPPAEKVELSAHQISALMASSEADSIAFQFGQHISKPLVAYTPAESHTMIRQWLQLADRAQIDGNQDRFALCAVGLERPELATDARYLALLESGAGPRTLDEIRALLA
ncbi:DUF4123 domain-containing protein [Duganella aceris]|uniref:DUF4123 domain-containing protein n=1 Tax=Duganella aceris TaxID=2703883 RepID=A0ABX0FL55_9BURK|nr:DUF4123 domain-containing protein [Duganella aceris]NGZ85331.1 DUF4123 domain-containing protein [Duganella aceris]